MKRLQYSDVLIQTYFCVKLRWSSCLRLRFKGSCFVNCLDCDVELSSVCFTPSCFTYIHNLSAFWQDCYIPVFEVWTGPQLRIVYVPSFSLFWPINQAISKSMRHQKNKGGCWKFAWEWFQGSICVSSVLLKLLGLRLKTRQNSNLLGQTHILEQSSVLDPKANLDTIFMKQLHKAC